VAFGIFIARFVKGALRIMIITAASLAVASPVAGGGDGDGLG